jgi:predicted RecA/RadA family phage recombinase
MAQVGIVLVSLGEVEEVTLSAAAIPGDIVTTPDGLAAIVQGVGPYASGDKAPVLTNAIINLPVATGTTIATGVKAEWDATNKLVVASSGTHILGVAYGAKVSGPTRMNVRLNAAKLSLTLN